MGWHLPVTVDHVNPRRHGPQSLNSRRSTASGRTLVPRLALYPSYVDKLDRWVAPRLHSSVLRNVDSAGFAREDDWAVGLSLPAPHLSAGATDRALDCLLDRASSGNELGVEEIGRLFRARGGDVRNLGCC